MEPKPILQKPPGFGEPTAPARKPGLPPFRPKPKRRSCCAICCCTFCIIMVILVLLIVIAAAIFYLVYEPSLPEFHLTSFRVPKLNVTNAEDGAYLNANTAARMEVRNRSGKMTWRFTQSRLRVSAEKGDLNLGTTNVAGFTVKEKDVGEVKVETSVKDMALNEKQKRRIKSAVDSKALVPSVEVITRTGVGLNSWNSFTISLTVVCGGLTMRQLDQGDPPRCSITLLRWIKISS